MSNQQKQTLKFFKRHSEEWNKKANDKFYSVMNDRHRAVHRCLDNYPKKSLFLDIGCGTGQLAIEASKNGFISHGIDFAEEMIEISKNNSQKENSDATFEVASIFNYTVKSPYDVISAMGFIEYITPTQLDELIKLSFDNLSSNGSICIGSRNRLFNLTTFNSYTNMEVELGVIETLLKESEVIISAKTNSEFLNNLRSFSDNHNLIQNEKHPITNIEVETRYQFTPSDLLARVELAGFEVQKIYPVNYHAFNPTLISSNDLKTLKREISELISNKYQDYHQLLPDSSSFVLEAKKCR